MQMYAEDTGSLVDLYLRVYKISSEAAVRLDCVGSAHRQSVCCHQEFQIQKVPLIFLGASGFHQTLLKKIVVSVLHSFCPLHLDRSEVPLLREHFLQIF